MPYRTKTYIIQGDPQPWMHTGSNHAGKGLFSEAKFKRIAFDLYLRQQQNDEPLFAKPLNAQIKFMLLNPEKPRSKSYRPDITHYERSRLNELLDYLLFSMRGICITDERIIVSLTTDKKFDKEPRTEIILTEIK